MKQNTALEAKVCIVTGKKYETNNILINKYPKEKPESEEMHLITGYGICPKVQEQLDAGYVAIVGIDSKKSEPGEDGLIKPENAYRTGAIVYVRTSALKNLGIPDTGKKVVFGDERLMELLTGVYKDIEDAESGK